MTEGLLDVLHNINTGALGWGVIVAAIFSLIQIAPIRINPWSFIAKHIGRALNKETFERLDRNEERTLEVKHELDDLRDHIGQMEIKVDDIDNKIDETTAVTARVRILRFNDELLRFEKHTKDAYDQVLRDIDDYEIYCKQHPNFANNKTKASVLNVKENYNERLRKHDFLAPKAHKDHEKDNQIEG